MRSRTIKAVEWFYLCVMMSIKFWWVLIRNLIAYGLADAIASVILYYATPKEDRDLHQKFRNDNHFNLKGSKVLSLIATFLISLWIALAVLVVRTRAANIVISVSFWIVAIWTLLYITYIVELTLVKAEEKYQIDKEYYLRAVVLMLRNMQLTLTIVVLLIVMTLFFIKNAVIAVLIMPGIIAACVCRLYELLAEKQRIYNK